MVGLVVVPVTVPFSLDGELLNDSDVSVLTVVVVKSARQLNSSAEYDVIVDDDDVEGGLLGANSDDAEVRG